ARSSKLLQALLVGDPFRARTTSTATNSTSGLKSAAHAVPPPSSTSTAPFKSITARTGRDLDTSPPTLSMVVSRPSSTSTGGGAERWRSERAREFLATLHASRAKKNPSLLVRFCLSLVHLLPFSHPPNILSPPILCVSSPFLDS
ncbi:hypothetical protein FRC19_011018, partial [Serendipita sp. 401]